LSFILSQPKISRRSGNTSQPITRLLLDVSVKKFTRPFAALLHTVSAAHPLKLVRICTGVNIGEAEQESEGGGLRQASKSLTALSAVLRALAGVCDGDSGGIDSHRRPGAGVSFLALFPMPAVAGEFEEVRGFSVLGECSRGGGGSEMMRGATAPQHDFAAGARGWTAGGLSFISVKERTTPEPENQYETQFDFANRWLYRSQRNQQTWFL